MSKLKSTSGNKNKKRSLGESRFVVLSIRAAGAAVPASTVANTITARLSLSGAVTPILSAAIVAALVVVSTRFPRIAPLGLLGLAVNAGFVMSDGVDLGHGAVPLAILAAELLGFALQSLDRYVHSHCACHGHGCKDLQECPSLLGSLRRQRCGSASTGCHALCDSPSKVKPTPKKKKMQS